MLPQLTPSADRNTRVVVGAGVAVGLAGAGAASAPERGWTPRVAAELSGTNARNPPDGRAKMGFRLSHAKSDLSWNVSSSRRQLVPVGHVDGAADVVPDADAVGDPDGTADASPDGGAIGDVARWLPYR
jgi:hypothetical protein